MRGLDSASASVTSNSAPSESTPQEAVSYQVKDGIAVVKIDIAGSKVNKLDQQVSTELRQVFDSVEQDGSIKDVVLISGKAGSFVAGADIKMLQGGCKTASEAEKISRDAQIQFERLEKCKKLIVASIMLVCKRMNIIKLIPFHINFQPIFSRLRYTVKIMIVT